MRRAPRTLALEHEEGLRAAAADGALWKLRITSVPEPQDTRAYIENALQMRADGNRFAFAVLDDATGDVLGSTSFHDILPAVKRVEDGWTWYRKSVQRSHVNTTCKLLMLQHALTSWAATWWAGAPTSSTLPRNAPSSAWAPAKTA